MSARDELRERALDPDTSWYDSDYTVDSLLDAHEAEVRRQCAAEIRALGGCDPAGGFAGYDEGMEIAAAHIETRTAG